MNNDTIKRMAEQCITDDQFGVGAFATLIISECLNAIDNTKEPDLGDSFNKAQHDASIVEVKNAIKSYFGINE